MKGQGTRRLSGLARHTEVATNRVKRVAGILFLQALLKVFCFVLF